MVRGRKPDTVTTGRTPFAARRDIRYMINKIRSYVKNKNEKDRLITTCPATSKKICSKTVELQRTPRDPEDRPRRAADSGLEAMDRRP